MKYLLFFIAFTIVGYLFLFIITIKVCNPFYIDYGDGYYISSDKEYGVDDLEYNLADSEGGNSYFCFHDTLGNIDTVFIHQFANYTPFSIPDPLLFGNNYTL